MVNFEIFFRFSIQFYPFFKIFNKGELKDFDSNMGYLYNLYKEKRIKENLE